MFGLTGGEVVVVGVVALVVVGPRNLPAILRGTGRLIGAGRSRAYSRRSGAGDHLDIALIAVAMLLVVLAWFARR